MSPPRYRGALTGGFDICVSFGILIANLVNFGTQKISAGWGWRLSLSLGGIPAFFLLLGVFLLPETPSNLIQRRRGDLQEARRVLQRIRGTTEVENELQQLAAAAALASRIAEEEHPFRRICRRNYRPHLVLALLLPFLQQLTGINAVNFYAPVMFRTIGQSESDSLLSTAVTRAISLSCTLLASIVLVDRLGRRPLFHSGGIAMIVSHAVLGGVLTAFLHDQGEVSKGIAYLVLAVVSVFVGAFGWSWGPLSWLVMSEIFPMEIRSAGQSIQVAANLLGTFAVAQSVLEMLCGLRAGIFFLFAGFVVVMSVFVYFLVPETKGVPLDEMGKVWRKHWLWKRYVDQVDAVPGGNKEDA